ncbi:MAG: agmatine deiminase family protein [Candidatus Cloacimonetes bacterium]|nr:agmatine deiminase family protein [Candidatus Cloacimonadota bacterium]
MRKLLLFGMIVFVLTQLWATPLELKHHLTPEEALLRETYNRDFFPTAPPTGPVRAVAEFEQMEAVLIRYPLGIPASLVAELSQEIRVITVCNASQENQALNAYSAAGADMSNLEFIHAPTESYWTRDYGPWFIFDGNNDLGVVNFPYNRPRPNDDDIPIVYAGYDNTNLFGMSVEHTGGNYMVDGIGIAASTDLVLSENSSLTQTDIEQFFLDFLGVHTYHMRPDPNNTYIDHIDCWAKFLAPDKILIREVPTNHPRYTAIEQEASWWATQTSSWGVPYEIYRVITPYNEPYTNSLILNNRVFVPVMGGSNDSAALAVYQQAMPGYNIIPVDDGNQLWQSTDALHCRTHELADDGMLYIAHIPVQTQAVTRAMVDIEADIFAHSGALLLADSLRVFYKTPTDTYFLPLQMVSFGNDTYRATIPTQTDGTLVEYYITAADASGRSANHPYIGASDPHQFTVVPDITPPIIVHTPLTYVPADDYPLSISAVVTDDYHVSEVFMEYIPEGDTNTYTVAFSETQDYIWQGTIDCIGREFNVDYRIIARDSATPANESTDPPTGWHSFTTDTTSLNNPLEETRIIGCFPNPLRGSGYISFYLSSVQSIEASVYNVKGQLVKRLITGNHSQGNHSIRWAGTDERGNSVGSGVYYVKLKSTGKSEVRKILLMK